ncbi:MAG: septum formation protein Maf [Bacteroidetes bacterium 4572_128]|nr:MAG: septum formation protein Maf [Bacteroidetes bacterium 4572_128]
MEVLENLKKYKIILASNSKNLKKEEVAIFLSKKKARSLEKKISDNEIFITADTIVCFEDEILGKPKNEKEAQEMLNKLSNNKHEVITGVCVFSKKKEKNFFTKTDVFFKEISVEEINYYIKNYKPFDKAGAYGIQEWIGLAFVEKIEGSYFNVVGLPISKLYDVLKKF